MMRHPRVTPGADLISSCSLLFGLIQSAWDDSSSLKFLVT